jgi:hypothetical protein
VDPHPEKAHGSTLGDKMLKRLTGNIETRAFGRGVWTVFVLHEVIPFAEIEHVNTFSPYPIEWFAPFAKWLAEKVKDEAVWVDTISNVMKYLKERDAFIYRIIKEDANLVELQIDHGLDKSIFNHELTIDVLVPNHWKKATITVTGESSTSWIESTWEYKKRNYVRFHAVPSGQTIVMVGQ